MRIKSIPLTGFICVFFSFAVFAETPVTIDNGYMDWQDIPAMVVFSSTYSPVYFARELDGDVEQFKVERSLYWKKGGTLIREIKSLADGENLNLKIEAYSNFAKEVSIFLYLYPRRDEERLNSFALELITGNGDIPGAVLLWERGRDLPKTAGSLKNGSFLLECSISIAQLPQSLTAGRFEELSFDVATCYHEAASGMYEEFFFTTIYLKDVVRLNDL